MSTHKRVPLIGAHTSIVGGYDNAVRVAASLGCSALQLFTKSSRSWRDRAITQEEVDHFIAARTQYQIDTIVSHASYLINIGSSDAATRKRSLDALCDELKRCNLLHISHLVLHPGAHTGDGIELGMQRIIENLDKALEAVAGPCMILLETMAGQGSQIGVSFEQLAALRDGTTHKRRIGFCFDTCHVFSAGYDLSSAAGLYKTLEQFDQVIGLQHLKAFHINDSKTPCGSHVDRHEELGKGTIPLAVFKALMQDARFADVPKLLETPTDDKLELWRREVPLLRQMAE